MYYFIMNKMGDLQVKPPTDIFILQGNLAFVLSIQICPSSKRKLDSAAEVCLKEVSYQDVNFHKAEWSFIPS